MYGRGVRGENSLKHSAQLMRVKPTLTEHILWQQLRRKQLDGFKFRRQHGIGCYIVDFYCARLKLIVEIDGKTHAAPEQIQKDKIRTAYFHSNGYKIARYSNAEVYNNLPELLRSLKQKLEQLTLAEASSPSHGGVRGGGH